MNTKSLISYFFLKQILSRSFSEKAIVSGSPLSAKLQQKEEKLDSARQHVKHCARKIESKEEELHKIKGRINTHDTELESREREFDANQLSIEDRSEELKGKDRQLKSAQLSIGECEKEVQLDSIQRTGYAYRNVKCRVSLLQLVIHNDAVAMVRNDTVGITDGRLGTEGIVGGRVGLQKMISGKPVHITPVAVKFSSSAPSNEVMFDIDCYLWSLKFGEMAANVVVVSMKMLGVGYKGESGMFSAEFIFTGFLFAEIKVKLTLMARSGKLHNRRQSDLWECRKGRDGGNARKWWQCGLRTWDHYGDLGTTSWLENPERHNLEVYC
ncbi:hypothetical protein DKX38_011726 [Salix brachista]|uniref:Uncharacterized protein n=1 Tax=Salix brachista TaxID=2182728 RepID=A0A5N5LZS6_9ROSI|nr:hypothetical protein DKX38_011726 [Salix brachista]